MWNQQLCSFSNNSSIRTLCPVKSSTPTSPRQQTPAISKWCFRSSWTLYSETISERPQSYSSLQTGKKFYIPCVYVINVFQLQIQNHVSLIDINYIEITIPCTSIPCYEIFIVLNRNEAIFAIFFTRRNHVCFLVVIYMNWLHSVLRIYAWNADIVRTWHHYC